MIQFSCPSCKTLMQAQDSQAGSAVVCPKCKTQMKVPVSVSVSQSPPSIIQKPNGTWAWLLQESKETALATWNQTIKLLNLGKNLWKKHSSVRESGDAQVVLGERMVQAGAGDPQIRTQIADLSEKLRREEAAKRSTGMLKTEQRKLLQALAAPAIAGKVAVVGMDGELANARQARNTSLKQADATGVANASLLPTDRIAWRRVAIGVGTVCAASLLSMCLMCAGVGSFLGGEGSVGSKDRQDTVLSADYYPHQPGLERRFKEKYFHVIKKEWFETKDVWRMIHHQDGTIETAGPPPFNKTSMVKHRLHDGYVELGLANGKWNPVLKIGAKPGESWERNGRQYAFKEFTTFQKKPCAVIEMKSEETVDKNGVRVREVETSWYIKGFGLAKQEIDGIVAGKTEPVMILTLADGEDEPAQPKPKSKYGW